MQENKQTASKTKKQKNTNEKLFHPTKHLRRSLGQLLCDRGQLRGGDPRLSLAVQVVAVHAVRVCSQQSNAIRVLFFPIFLSLCQRRPCSDRQNNSTAKQGEKKCLSVSGPTATWMTALGCEPLVVPRPWRVPARQRQTVAPLGVRLIFMNPWVPPLRTWG